MIKSILFVFIALISVTLFSCSKEESTTTSLDPIRELQFEVVDSIMVDVMEDLVILDYQEKLDQFLMKERRGGKIFLVNGNGEMIGEVELAGEGPNQVSMIWEGRFLGKDRFIFKEISATMDFHIFDRDFKKLKKINGPAIGLNAIFISFFRQTFTAWVEEGNDFILGEEVNSYNPADVEPDKIGGDFYNLVKTGFLYDLGQDSIKYLNLYPESWAPRKTTRWIGQSFPFLTVDLPRKKAVILPPIGDHLFLYDFDGNSLTNEKAVALSHPDRRQEIPDVSREHVLYPSFSDVKSFGDYRLVIFYTAVPEDVFNEFRAKGENYWQDPEWGKAQAKYRNPRYIVVEGDRQIGILNKLPVEGNVNLGLLDGTLIVKADDGEVERDYNLFYKLRLVEK
ncbi:hypothetical protein J2X69_001722 [Algoriphagus sp. 4150]|uniref:hypothetical protein n=1 Tax=Algoriphagus sp. 4150 TaxID=2817756 RepID=UPI002859B642|nr:hypothetical protein [Algoriphagus sp. 4150]MDR7129385.1 hypothetical protein [Algoriphagus sp. 4150]